MTDSHATPALLAGTIDCVDLEVMTRFWAGPLDVDFEIHEPFGFLAPSEGRRVTSWIQAVPEERVGKNRVHLDFVVEDLEAASDRVTSLGGSVGDRHEWQGFIWNTCADPEGNLFDVMAAQQLP